MKNILYKIKYNIRGFSLIELSLLLLIVGSLVSLSITSIGVNQTIIKSSSTNTLLSNIKYAIYRYAEIRGSYPCPSDPTLTTLDTGYGSSARDVNGYCDSTNMLSVDVDSAANYGSGEYTAQFSPDFIEGGVPCLTLGLGRDCDLDPQGNRISYAVANVLTQPTPCVWYIKDDGTTEEVPYHFAMLKDMDPAETGAENYDDAENKYYADPTDEPHFVLKAAGERYPAGAYNQQGERIQRIEISPGTYIDSAQQAINHHLDTAYDNIYFHPEKPIDNPDAALGAAQAKTAYDDVLVWGKVDETYVDMKYCLSCRNCAATHAVRQINTLDSYNQCSDHTAACACTQDSECDIGSGECCNEGTGACSVAACSVSCTTDAECSGGTPYCCHSTCQATTTCSCTVEADCGNPGTRCCEAGACVESCSTSCTDYTDCSDQGTTCCVDGQCAACTTCETRYSPVYRCNSPSQSGDDLPSGADHMILPTAPYTPGVTNCYDIDSTTGCCYENDNSTKSSISQHIDASPATNYDSPNNVTIMCNSGATPAVVRYMLYATDGVTLLWNTLVTHTNGTMCSGIPYGASPTCLSPTCQSDDECVGDTPHCCNGTCSARGCSCTTNGDCGSYEQCCQGTCISSTATCGCADYTDCGAQGTTCCINGQCSACTGCGNRCEMQYSCSNNTYCPVGLGEPCAVGHEVTTTAPYTPGAGGCTSQYIDGITGCCHKYNTTANSMVSIWEWGWGNNCSDVTPNSIPITCNGTHATGILHPILNTDGSTWVRSGGLTTWSGATMCSGKTNGSPPHCLSTTCNTVADCPGSAPYCCNGFCQRTSTCRCDNYTDCGNEGTSCCINNVCTSCTGANCPIKAAVKYNCTNATYYGGGNADTIYQKTTAYGVYTPDVAPCDVNESIDPTTGCCYDYDSTSSNSVATSLLTATLAVSPNNAVVTCTASVTILDYIIYKEDGVTVLKSGNVNFGGSQCTGIPNSGTPLCP